MGELRSFGDEPAVLESVGSLLADPRERTAVALWLLGHHTPEHVGILFGQGSEELLSAWTGPGMRESTRHLYRRRAQTVIEVHGG